ncbi:hypothetical protein SU32_15825 [Ahrensia marina]|uniref:Uncharacterized protein n=1 Tax=Ahrensia marina TaxID=1514904 RepID=A0A0M9GKQ8_9HYPH|nr:hypothetical protein SU32_15825 [Ahrensia marina]
MECWNIIELLALHFKLVARWIYDWKLEIPIHTLNSFHNGELWVNVSKRVGRFRPFAAIRPPKLALPRADIEAT